MFRLDVEDLLQPKSQLVASQLEVPPSHNPKIISHRRSLLGAPGSLQPWSGTAPTMSPFYSGNGRILAALFGCPWFRWLFG